MFDNLQLYVEDGGEAEGDDEKDVQQEDKHHSNTNEEILSQKMQENTIEDGKKTSKVNSQTDSNKLNSDISTAITPNTTKNDKNENDKIENEKNENDIVENKIDSNPKNDSANEKMEQNEENEQPDNSI